ncbi:hypothetical protein M5X00_23190 [Paenibacillus alvei]|uniref:Uncharacterized protein n=1 Tax=Paenibacillus alvei TaxID=44250 RepID=A0ABT4H3C7_PAEAL|nr:hypothetical protein [Paenibacillus alvei]EJW14311.1 hypothetical protein PAV_14c00040 [Paenibacillus alvei DSM 29]MCY9540565.1 hypothetical protein [Paenibacillus alvei]MCY9737317.1 hypothetical protein [Paenibacillus alvei]MCY9757147.1 hypothetical protein [Paenibacillus alvei]MCY9763149.1 hypothetical protein [Paenibacillus alvei]
MQAKQALKLFFKEKKLEPRTFAVSHNDQVHMVESRFLINMIVNHAPDHEQQKIRTIIAQIDFRDGDVNDYLSHLANCFVITNY